MSHTASSACGHLWLPAMAKMLPETVTFPIPVKHFKFCEPPGLPYCTCSGYWLPFPVYLDELPLRAC
jgi:hypothetical protein